MKNLLRFLLVALLLVSDVAFAQQVTTTQTRLLTFRKQSTRAVDAANGAVSYTGFGFQPTTCVGAGGTSDSTVYKTLFSSVDSAGNSLAVATYGAAMIASVSSVFFAFFDATATNNQTAVWTSYDTDGLTLTWTKTGTPAALTATIYMTCSR